MSATEQEIQQIIANAQDTASTYSDLAKAAADQAETVAQTLFVFNEPSVDVPSVDSPLSQAGQIQGSLDTIVQNYLQSSQNFRDVISDSESLFDASLTSLLDAADDIDLGHIDTVAGQIDSELTSTQSIVDQAKADVEALDLTGVSKAALDAQFDRARTRANVDLARQEERLVDLAAARGFSLPPGTLFEQIQQINFEASRQLNDLNQDLVTKENNVAIENARLEAQLKLQRGDLIIRSQLQLFDSLVRGKVSLTQFKVEAARTIIAAKESAVSAVATFVDARVRAHLAPLEVDARIAQLQGNMEQVLSNYYQAYVSAQRLTTDAQIANARVITDFAGLATRAGADAVQSRVQAAIGAANAFSEIASSALAALNTVSSLSSESISSE